MILSGSEIQKMRDHGKITIEPFNSLQINPNSYNYRLGSKLGVVFKDNKFSFLTKGLAPEIEKRMRWQWRRPGSTSWRVDETYIRVGGKWVYLYRAVDKFGDTIDCYLSSTRNTKAAKRFLGKALKGLKDRELPDVLNTDKAPTYGAAIATLKDEGKCLPETEHRQAKYLNNIVEADHGKLKQLIRPVRGFKTMKTAYATIKGFEVMRALRKGQARAFNVQGGIKGEVRMIERAFGLGPCALTEAYPVLENALAGS